jgi:hypothetical protein
LKSFSEVFQENSQANFEKFQILISIYVCQLATHVHGEFQLSTCYPDRLRQIFDLFARKFQSFSRKVLSKYQKSQIQLATYVHAKFQLSSFYPDRLSRKIQDFLKENSEFSKSEKSSE